MAIRRHTGILVGLIILLMLWVAVAGAGAASEWSELWRASVRGYISGTLQPVPIGERQQMAALALDEGWLMLLDAEGKQVWQRRLADRAFESPSVGDVDGDGMCEILTVDQRGVVYCFDTGGKLRWRFWLEGKLPDWMLLMKRLHGSAYATPPCLADLDGDAVPEVVVSDIRGWLTCLEGRGNLRWRLRLPDEIKATPWVSDVDGDGRPEVVTPCTDGRLYCLSAEGKLKWTASTAGDASRSSPIAADLDGDGKPVVMVGTDEGLLTAVRGSEGKRLWEFQTEGTIRSSLAAVDLDGDGKLEVLVGNEGDRRFGFADLHCLEADGSQRWKLRFERQNAIFLGLSYSPPVVDLHGDGQPKIIVVPRYSTKLFVVNASGEIEAEHSLPAMAYGCSLFTRLGGDQHLKLLVTYSGISCYDTGVDSRTVRILWPAPSPKSAPAKTAPAPAVASTGELAVPVEVGKPVPVERNWQAATVSVPRAPQDAALMVSVTTPVGSRYGAIAYGVAGRPLSTEVRFEAFSDGSYLLQAQLVDRDQRLLGETTAALQLAPVRQATERLTEGLRHLEAQQAQFARSNPPAARHLVRARADLERERKQLRAFAGPSERAQRAYMTLLGEVAGEASRLGAWADALAHQQRTRGAVAFLAAQQTNPWAEFDPTLPLREAASEIRLDCYQGEYRSLVLNIANFTDRELRVRARATELMPQARTAAQPAGGSIELHKVVPVATMRGATVWDALPPLDQDSTLRVPPWQARQLWVTVHAPRGAPGDHRAELTLDVPQIPAAPQQKITLHARVLPLARPLKSPLAFANWAYLQRWPMDSPARSQVLEDLLSHGTNVFVHVPVPHAEFDAEGELTGPLDFTAHDAEIRPLVGKGQMLFMGSQYALSGPAELYSPTWAKAMRQHLQAWVAHLKELGVGYEDFAFYPYDEAYASNFDNLLTYARLVKEADPQVRIYVDLGGALPTPQQLHAGMSGLIDIWQPWQGHFEEQTVDWLEELKATGKPVWMYRESNNMKELGALGYYRRIPWLAWERGLVGIGIYTYLYGNPWTVPERSFNEFGLVYPVEAGVVPSKRWEALREGIQDYEALWLLRQAVTAAKQQGRDVSAAERLLREAPQRVLASGVEYEVLSQYRQRIAQATLALTGATR